MERPNISDKVDQIVTNRFLALPIFALVMWLTYFLAIQTVGTIGTDWVNDVLFWPILFQLLFKIFLIPFGIAGWLQLLVLDGIVAGCGAILGFCAVRFLYSSSV